MVFNYTQRKNKTLRGNRQIKLDLNEVDENDDSDKYSDNQIGNHTISTTEKLQYVKSIYDRIGKKRECLFYLIKQKWNI